MRSAAPTLAGGCSGEAVLPLANWYAPSTTGTFVNPAHTFNVVWQDTTSTATYCSATAALASR